jgi:uncharacterized protein YceH (UPF0502 family)
VLGVLIEKALTTATQYPLSLNALVSGCNQKNNRDPVTSLSEDDVLEAIDGLKRPSLVREVMLSGSRVQKFRHVAREGLDVGTTELVILAELMLRGPQTVGELRGRASRMHALESTDVVHNVLQYLMGLDAPMVREIAPAPGSRAPRFAQLLCPNLHPVEPMTTVAAPSSTLQASGVTPVSPDINTRLERLERELAELRQIVTTIAQGLGELAPSHNAD